MNRGGVLDMLEMREQKPVVNRFKLLFFHSSIMRTASASSTTQPTNTPPEKSRARRPFHSFSSWNTGRDSSEESVPVAGQNLSASMPAMRSEEESQDDSDENRMQKIRHRVRAMSLDLIGKMNSPTVESAVPRAAPNPTFLDLKSIDLARELTMEEFELYCSVEPRELVAQAWQKDNKMEIAPNLTRLIERFNKIGYWVATEILTKHDLKMRVKYIKKFIKIAYKCYECNNFNGVMQILSGLNNSSVKRLKVLSLSISPPN